MASLHQPASLAGLPVELRAKIFEYLLPCKTLKRYHAFSRLPNPGKIRKGFRLPDYSTPSNDRPTGGLLTVSRQFYADVSAILRLRNKRCHTILLTWLFVCRSQIHQMVNKNIPWTWEALFPYEDLSKVPELRIEIGRETSPEWWALVVSALKSLCDKELSRMALPQLLTIVVENYRLEWDARSHSKARPADIQAALNCFRVLADKIERCNIELPFWMEFEEGMTELHERLFKELNAKITFCKPY